MADENADGNASDLNASGTQVTGIRAQFSDPLKNHEAFTGMNKADDLANAYLTVSGKAKDYEGKLANSIPKISDKSTQEEKDAYYKAIGRPEKPEGYEFEIPAGANVEPELIGEFRKIAFENGASKELIAKIADWYFKNQVEGLGNTGNDIIKELQQRKEEAENKLKTEWGGQYTTRLDNANKFVQRAVSDEEYEYAKGAGWTNDIVFIKMCERLHGLISEDAFISPKGTPPRQREKTPGGMPILDFPSMS